MNRSECIVPGCRILADKLFCPGCWARVPQGLRDEMARTYRPGQRDGLAQPSAEYIAAAKAAIESAARPADLGDGWRLQEVTK